MLKQFNRFELKYVVRAADFNALRADLALHMRPDANGRDGAYAITSLYYDSPDLACMRAKIEGIKFRRKLRIRRYGRGDGPVFVEIKQRINRTTQKRRLVLELDRAYDLCADRFAGGFEDAADAAVADEARFMARALDWRPTCLVGYRRYALTGGEYEPGLRVTFDSGLWAALPDDGLDGGAARHRLLAPQFLVMEVKANEAVPLWLANLLARHECALRRYSKYCAGVARLGELGLLSALGETVLGAFEKERGRG